MDFSTDARLIFWYHNDANKKSKFDVSRET